MKDVGSTIGCQKLAGRLVSVRIPLGQRVYFPLLGSTLLSPFAIRHMAVFKVSSSRWEQGRLIGYHNSPGITRSAITLCACPQVEQSHAHRLVCCSNAVKSCPLVLGPYSGTMVGSVSAGNTHSWPLRAPSLPHLHPDPQELHKPTGGCAGRTTAPQSRRSSTVSDGQAAGAAGGADTWQRHQRL